MPKTFTFGQVSGIPLRVHWNWFIIAALVTWSLASGYFPQEQPSWGTGTYWAIGLATAILFFASVLFHELGHACIAQKEGVPVKSITLFIFGGIAHIGHEPETPGSEFRIVGAGPLCSLGLASGFYLLSALTPYLPEVSSSALYLGRINVILAVFNLLPGFPLDGGRILRSLLWMWKRDYLKATRWAANTGLAISGFFILAGILLLFWGHYFNGVWVAFIGWYLSVSSRASYRQIAAEEDRRVSALVLDQDEAALEKAPQPRAVSGGTLQRRKSLAAPTSVYGTAFLMPELPKNMDKPEE